MEWMTPLDPFANCSSFSLSYRRLSKREHEAIDTRNLHVPSSDFPHCESIMCLIIIAWTVY